MLMKRVLTGFVEQSGLDLRGVGALVEIVGGRHETRVR